VRDDGLAAALIRWRQAVRRLPLSISGQLFRLLNENCIIVTKFRRVDAIWACPGVVLRGCGSPMASVASGSSSWGRGLGNATSDSLRTFAITPN
jgi:hypothetical protein